MTIRVKYALSELTCFYDMKQELDADLQRHAKPNTDQPKPLQKPLMTKNHQQSKV